MKKIIQIIEENGGIIIFPLLILLLITIQQQVEEEECVKFYKENNYITQKCRKYNIEEQLRKDKKNE